jgi:hypothetical protein
VFESAIVRKLPNQERGIDAGLLAETLLFYGNVHLLLDHGSLTGLLRAIGPNTLLSLIKNGFLKATYFTKSFGTQTARDTGLPVHNFTAYEFVGSQDDGVLKGREKKIISIFERAIGTDGNAKKTARAFLRLVPVKKFCPGFEKSVSIMDLATEDLNDTEYVQYGVQIALVNLVPGIELPKGWMFKVSRLEGGFLIHTNLDFDAINQKYPDSVSSGQHVITAPFLANHILEARAELCFASTYLSELVTTPTSSQIIQRKFDHMLKRRSRSSEEIALFQDTYLESGRAVRDAINSGQRSLDEFIKVLEKAQRFKGWLRGSNPDVGLLKEYYDAATRNTWIDRLPMKALRFAVFSGLGTITDTVTSIGIGAADSFLFDKMTAGWKPNHFIEGPLKKFVDTT